MCVLVCVCVCVSLSVSLSLSLSLRARARACVCVCVCSDMFCMLNRFHNQKTYFQSGTERGSVVCCTPVPPSVPKMVGRLLGEHLFKDGTLMDFISLALYIMLGDNYRGRFESLLLCVSFVTRAA